MTWQSNKRFSSQNATTEGCPFRNRYSFLRIDPCLRYDPTFMTDPENHADNPGTSRDAGSSLRVFSPLGNGAKTFDQTYLAVYAQTDIRVTVHSLAGVLLRTLVDETQRVGESSFQWDGKNIQGILQPEGKYAVTIEARDHTAPEAVRSESIDVAIDNTRPAVNLSRIEGDPFSLRGYHLYGEISDQNADTYHVYRVAGAQATSLFTGRINSIPSTKELASIDTSEWEPGNYFLRVEAFDLGGNHTATSETSGSADPRSNDPPSMPLAVGRAASVPPHLQAKVNGQSPYSSGEENRVPDNPHVFFDDDLPAGATPVDAAQWNWSPIAYSGTRSHSTGEFSSRSQFFLHARPGYPLSPQTNLIQYVFLDHGVREIEIQFFTGEEDGEHRIFWGENILPGGVLGTPSLLHAGGLPPGNDWVRLPSGIPIRV